MQLGDVPITYSDITKSREKLGYQPQTDIKDGIRKFAEWFLIQKEIGSVLTAQSNTFYLGFQELFVSM